MRGIAALSVVCGHVISVSASGQIGIDRNIAVGALAVLQSGVDVFFVISGFIIATGASSLGLTRGRKGAFEFAANRFARIYPIYWIVLTAAVISSYWISLGLPVDGDKLTIDQILLNTSANYFVPPAWSLYFEVSFYAAMAVVVLLAPSYVFMISLTGLAAVALLDALAVSLPGVWSNPLTLEFGLGVIIAAVVRAGVVKLAWTCLIGAAAAFTIGGYLHIYCAPVANGWRAATFGVGAALLIYATVAAELRGQKFPLSLQYLGNMSYSLYLWHFLILTWLINALESIPGAFQTAMWVAIIVAASAASYRYIEKPLLAWSKVAVAKIPGVFSRRRTAPASAPGI